MKEDKGEVVPGGDASSSAAASSLPESASAAAAAAAGAAGEAGERMLSRADGADAGGSDTAARNSPAGRQLPLLSPLPSHVTSPAVAAQRSSLTDGGGRPETADGEVEAVEVEAAYEEPPAGRRSLRPRRSTRVSAKVRLRWGMSAGLARLVATAAAAAAAATAASVSTPLPHPQPPAAPAGARCSAPAGSGSGSVFEPACLPRAAQGARAWVSVPGRS